MKHTQQEPYQVATQVRKDFNADFKAPDFEKTCATFGDLIWQILVNETMAGKEVAFTVTLEGGENEIVMADATGGYHRSWVNFVNARYDECTKICNKLNEIVFGLSSDDAMMIVAKSMRKRK